MDKAARDFKVRNIKKRLKKSMDDESKKMILRSSICSAIDQAMEFLDIGDPATNIEEEDIEGN